MVTKSGSSKTKREFIFVIGEDLKYVPKRLTYKRAHRIHEKITVKRVKVKAIGIWRMANLSNIKMHDRVRLISNPFVEGEVRRVLKKKGKAEVSHMGTPRFIPVNKLRVWVRKRVEIKRKKK